jgi:uncharacterized protein (DUF169 family)
MDSRIAQALGLVHQPVALLWADEAPAGAVRFQKGRWGCLMWLVAGAAQGKVAACDRETFGCFGGGVGFGFGDQYRQFPGGMECFCRFLSTGNEASEQGRAVAEQVRPHMRPEAYEEFLHGERYLRSPEVVEGFVRGLPVTEIPARYVVLKPLSSVDPSREEPRVVAFFADPDQISALVVLANYRGPDNERVIVPFAAGCQAVGIYPFREAHSENPRAVLGLVDLSARLQVRKTLGPQVLSFAVPFAMFRRMEDDVAGSFLERPTWRALRGG